MPQHTVQTDIKVQTHSIPVSSPLSSEQTNYMLAACHSALWQQTLLQTSHKPHTCTSYAITNRTRSPKIHAACYVSPVVEQAHNVAPAKKGIVEKHDIVWVPGQHPRWQVGRIPI